MRLVKKSVVTGIPYEVHVYWHEEFEEFEAVVPALGSQTFTAAADSCEVALRLLKESFSEMLEWFVGDLGRSLPPPDIDSEKSFFDPEAQPKEAGLSCILVMA